MSFFYIFVSTHLGIIDIGIIDLGVINFGIINLGVIDLGIIDLTTDKIHLYTIVPCFSGGSWWGEVVSDIPGYATCRFWLSIIWRRKRGCGGCEEKVLHFAVSVMVIMGER
jgi:hypothetical protein